MIRAGFRRPPGIASPRAASIRCSRTITATCAIGPCSSSLDWTGALRRIELLTTTEVSDRLGGARRRAANPPRQARLVSHRRGREVWVAHTGLPFGALFRGTRGRPITPLRLSAREVAPIPQRRARDQARSGAPHGAPAPERAQK